jgi:hypothetical protein
MVRKKSNTSHLLIRRTYSGKLYTRHHSYNWKSDADKESKSLRRDGYKVRVHSSPLEQYRYTIYKRGK